MPDTRYADRFNREWPPVLRAFLATIPAEGWEGTCRELWWTIYRLAGPRTVIPYGPNCVVRDIEAEPEILREAGIMMERRRTAKERTVVFTHAMGKRRRSAQSATAPTIDNLTMAELETELDGILADLKKRKTDAEAK